jgi:ribosomal protein S18 acetylase RimI-like enzyme
LLTFFNIAPVWGKNKYNFYRLSRTFRTVDSSFYLSNPPVVLNEKFTTGTVGTVTVRTLEQADIIQAANVIGDSFQIGAAFGRWLMPLFKLGIREDLYSRWREQDPQRAVALVATINRSKSKVVGTIEVTNRGTLYHASLAKRYAYIANLAVDDGYRSLGIGRQLINQCESIASQWGFGYIYLHVMAENPAANHLYTKLGFEVLCSDRTWHLLPWKRSSRLFLRKALA